MTTSVEASASPAPVAVSPWRGWVVTLAALGINLAAGTLYAWSVLGRALATRKESPWTKTEAAMPFAVATVTFALMMIFAGRVQDKIGPRRVALLGGIVLGGGFIAASFAETANWMAAAFGIVGLGIGLAYSATTPAAIKWFAPSKKGLITGLVVSGVGLAAVYASPVAQYMLDQGMTIPQILMILGICTIVSIGVLSQIVTNPPAGYKPQLSAPGTMAQKKAGVARRDVNWPEMLGTPQFYLLWVTFVLAAAPGLMMIANISLIAKQNDGSWKTAAFLLPMVLAAFNAAGRVVGGFVSDRLGRTNTMMLFFLLQAANMFLFPLYTSHVLLIFGAAFTGLCYGTIFTLMPAATADFYGVKNLGVNFGCLFTAFGVAGSTGALLGGKVSDIFGSYDKAFVIVGVMLLVAVVLVFFTKAPKLPTLSTGAFEIKA